MAPSTMSSVAQQPRRAPAGRTDGGQATVALIRFERAFAALARMDRAHVAETRAQLAGQARGAA